ncbi:MAG: CPBP family intramembrane glutamic endopeptidase [Alphaproteobacteria bacterium]
MVIILFETFLLAVAIALALWWNIDLPGSMELTQTAVLLGAGAAIVPNLALALGAGSPWMKDLQERTAAMMRRVFGGRPGAGAALAVAYGGVAEELLFRGVLVPALSLYMSPWLAVVLVGLGFGLLHPVSRLYVALAALLGIFWGALFLWTDNLLVPVIAHALNNVIAMLYYSRLLR